MSELSERHEREEKFYSVMKLREEMLALEERISILEGCAESTEIEAEADNGMDAKASAIGMAQSLGLDDAIRIVARSGSNRGPNRHASWENMDILAKFGAATNSVSVKIIAQGGQFDALNNVKVYSASDFGRHIETFRYGPWVHRLIDHANDLRQANEFQSKIDAAAKAKAEAVKFEEVDF